MTFPFSLLNRTIYDLLRDQDYMLVIDEVLECVSQYPITKDDHRVLFGRDLVHVDDRNRLRWNHREWPNYKGKFSDIRDLCDNGSLVWYRGSVLIWEFPADFLGAFSEVFILTYLFMGQPMEPYFRANDVPYDLKTLEGGELIDYGRGSNIADKYPIRKLIEIVEDSSLNALSSDGRC